MARNPPSSPAATAPRSANNGADNDDAVVHVDISLSKDRHDATADDSTTTTARATPEAPAVELRNIHKTYMLGLEGVPALRGVTCSIARGEFVVILGKSGGGKTSMLNVIGTIDRPTRGDLKLCGLRVDASSSDAELAHIRLHMLGFVFQSFNLLPSLSALENVELPMILAGLGSRAQRRKRAIRLLTRVGMAERLHHTPSQMSGGEQQRVTIARALANSPTVLICDEATGDLDATNAKIVMKLITDLNVRSGVTCILVTHDTSLKAYAHRVLHMLDGRIAREEVIPSFVREAALEELNGSPAVTALLALDAQRKEEAARARAVRARLRDARQSGIGSAGDVGGAVRGGGGGPGAGRPVPWWHPPAWLLGGGSRGAGQAGQGAELGDGEDGWEESGDDEEDDEGEAYGNRSQWGGNTLAGRALVGRGMRGPATTPLDSDADAEVSDEALQRVSARAESARRARGRASALGLVASDGPEGPNRDDQHAGSWWAGAPSRLASAAAAAAATWWPGVRTATAHPLGSGALFSVSADLASPTYAAATAGATGAGTFGSSGSSEGGLGSGTQQLMPAGSEESGIELHIAPTAPVEGQRGTDRSGRAIPEAASVSANPLAAGTGRPRQFVPPAPASAPESKSAEACAVTAVVAAGGQGHQQAKPSSSALLLSPPDTTSPSSEPPCSPADALTAAPAITDSTHETFQGGSEGAFLDKGGHGRVGGLAAHQPGVAAHGTRPQQKLVQYSDGVANGTPSSGTPSTLTGLTGVSAISHALFSAGGGEGGGGPAGQQPRGVVTVLRSPGSYATHIFALKTQAAAVEEGLRRAAKEAAKEVAMRAAVEEKRAIRAAVERERGGAGTNGK